jgi:hypothetical protein
MKSRRQPTLNSVAKVVKKFPDTPGNFSLQIEHVCFYFSTGPGMLLLNPHALIVFSSETSHSNSEAVS